MAFRGTGLPDQSSDAIAQGPGFIDADKLGSAAQWTSIAHSAGQIADEGLNTYKADLAQAKVGAVADFEVRNRTTFSEQRDRFHHDPQGFKAWYDGTDGTNGFSNGALGNVPAWMVPHARQFLSRQFDSAYDSILGEKRSRDHQLNVQSLKARLDQSDNDVIASAVTGTLDVPHIQEYKAILASGVATGLISPDEVDRRTTDLENRATAQTFIKSIGDEYRTNRANGEQAAPIALKAAEERILRNPDLKLDETHRYGYYHKATAEIHALEAERKQDLRDARLGMTEAFQALARGVRVAPEAIDSIVDQLNRAGGQADSARLRASAARADQLDSFSRQPLTEQTRQLGIFAGTAAATSPFEARLIERESSGSPGQVNRLGYVGLYQFGAPRLADLGIYTPGQGENLADWSTTAANAPGKWSGTFSIPGFPAVKSLADFRENASAQKAVFDLHRSRMDQEIAERGLNKFEGQTVGGVAITRDALYGMMHLGGARGAERFLTSGGTDVAKDAFGSSVTDYAQLGAPGTKITAMPGVDFRLVAGAQKTVNDNASRVWADMEKDLDAGVRPNPQALSAVLNAASTTGNHALLETIGARLDRFDTAAEAGRASGQEQRAALTELNRQAAAGTLSPGAAAFKKDLERRIEVTQKGLDENPISHTVGQFASRFRTPDPLDPGNSDAFRAGLAYRTQIAQFAAENWRVAPRSALDKPDFERVGAAIDAADPRTRARIYSDIASIPDEGVRNATLAKLGEKGASAMIEAYAGGLFNQSRDVAESILRGQSALRTDKRYDALKDDKSTFNDQFDKALPPIVFSLPSRTNPLGAYATIKGATLARYADLSAQAGDVTADINADRLTKAINDVTGGVLTFNGKRVIAPERGMTQERFDRLVYGLTDADLPGMTTINGTPITASYLRSKGRLEAIGDGQYLVQASPNGDHPYAVYGAETGMPSPYIIDLRGRPETGHRPGGDKYRTLTGIPRG